MSVTEVLQLVDHLVFKHTGKHLNNLQKNVVQGIWQGQTYNEIANEFGYDSENHIGNVCRELYKILTEQLGEEVNKSNFCWTIERLENSFNSSLIGLGINGSFNSCQSRKANDIASVKKDKLNISHESYYNLIVAPKITHFYGREEELTRLSHWLIEQNARLISVLGLPGIGKTTLVKQFVDLNLQHFDAVIWKSIKLSQSLDSMITEISTDINTEPILADNKFTQLFNTLHQQRCLIILDDVQELFVRGQFAGQYQSQYKDYQTLFAKMAEIEHQSTLILISQEQCREMLSLDDDLYPVKCLELEGLNGTESLRNQGLKDEERWLNLINLYEGNPAYLKDIASLIKNVFLGNVSDLLNEDSLILTEDMKSVLRELFDKLSVGEKQIIFKFSQSNRPMSMENLRQGLELSAIDLINGLQSLSRRYLLKKVAGEKVLFDLSLVIREYVKSFSQN